MHNKRALQMILGSVGMLALLWLLFACVAPPGADPVSAGPPEIRDLQGETCKTYTSVDVPKAIPQSASAFTSSTLPVWGAGAVSNLTVSFTISHTWPAGLDMALCAPRQIDCWLVAGDLTSDAGEYTIAFSTDPTHETFDDIYDGPPYTGSYPAIDDPGGMSRFVNTVAAGSWRLAARNQYAYGVGSITAWNIEICTVPARWTTTPTTIPTATVTPKYGCTDSQFVAVDNGQINPCDCSDPLFELAPESASGSGSGGQFTTVLHMCAPLCSKIVGSVSINNSANTKGSWITGIGIHGCDTYIYPKTTPVVNATIVTITGDDGPVGCFGVYCNSAGNADVDGFIADGLAFSPNVLAYPATCGEGSSYSYDYTVTWGECPPFPTNTPGPTLTPTSTMVCPTSTPSFWGWWMW